MSKLFTLNNKDFFKGFIMAILVPAVLIVQQSLESGTLVLNWKAILMASISGALAYLMKNFFTTETVLTVKEPIYLDGEYQYTQEQNNAVNECVVILDNVNLELLGTRPKDR